MNPRLKEWSARVQAYRAAFVRARAKLGEYAGARSSAFERLRTHFYRALWHDTAAALGATVHDLGDEYLRIVQGSAATIVNRSDVMLDSRLALKVAGHKPLCYRLFAEIGVPVAPHLVFDLSALDEAWKWVQARGTEVVVKPARDGSVGRGVTTGIRTKKELQAASLRAAANGPRLMVEQCHRGESFRLLYLDGRLLDAVHRGPPTVVGDGRSPLKKLVQAENAGRLAGEISALHPLRVDLEMKNYLRLAGRHLGQVPAAGEVVALKRVVNQNARRDNRSVVGSVHADTIALGSRLVGALGLELAGIDVLTSDISHPLAETGGVVNEVNSTPGLHHHYLLSNLDPSRAVARDVLQYVLAAAEARRRGRPGT